MGQIKPISNDHSGEWHREKFIEFSWAKEVIGEPTPHMRVVGWMSRDCSDEEFVWRAGCYLAAYSVITGEGIWREWSWERITNEPEGLAPWLQQNWAGIHTRKPRRCVRTVKQFNDCLLGFARWMRTELPLLRTAVWSNSQIEYDGWWKSAETIPYFGRYVSIRLLEYLRRHKYLSAHLYDIRAVGAHSPIRCLMLLQPESVPDLSTGAPKIVDQVAETVRQRLVESGLDQSYFTFATLLCEYRGCYEDGGDYAGNQHDEELEYSLSKYAKHWSRRGFKSQLYEARATIDPHECLGEIQGWSGRRLDAAHLMRSKGVVWSDLKYDYVKTVYAGKVIER